jgi:hypothetical protein
MNKADIASSAERKPRKYAYNPTDTQIKQTGVVTQSGMFM